MADINELKQAHAVVKAELDSLNEQRAALAAHAHNLSAKLRGIEAQIKVAQMPAEEVAAIAAVIQAQGIASAEVVNGG